MNQFTSLSATAITLPLRDVDTDMIIPAQYLTSTSRDGYGENLFRRLRDSDSNFPFNQERFSKAQILIVDHNFGCGSSREHAVWAILGWGIRVVIGKSFADIFHANSLKNGLVLITLPEKVVDVLLDEAGTGDYELSVDLQAQTITLANGDTHSFEFDPFRKHCILRGIDDIEYIRSSTAKIDEFRARQREVTFFSTLSPNR